MPKWGKAFGEKFCSPAEAPLLIWQHPGCPLSHQQVSFSTATAIPQHSPVQTPSLGTSSTSRKSALWKDRIPGKQMSYTWKNFVLYLISPAWGEPGESFKQCRLRKHQGTVGHETWANSGSPGLTLHPGQSSFCWSQQLNAL